MPSFFVSALKHLSAVAQSGYAGSGFAKKIDFTPPLPLAAPVVLSDSDDEPHAATATAAMATAVAATGFAMNIGSLLRTNFFTYCSVEKITECPVECQRMAQPGWSPPPASETPARAGARQSRKGQWRRKQILAATIRLVARNGGRGTSLAQIASEAGVTQQGLLYYFPTKDDLLNAALDVRDERDAVTHEPWEGLEFIDTIVERIRGWSDEPEMIGMFTLLLVENLGDPAPLRDRLAKRYDMVRDQYAESVRAGQ